ncbi:helix-turn-helix transcriptional regulator [Nocardia brasiliensis]|uniref:helix-turn-helix transcriptional regulator n=1 Tax=Nocardia brasiliensis TaxID=37326 RepID=UPI00068BE62D|nr:hypothetical protein [Nocardia brasiliensis]
MNALQLSQGIEATATTTAFAHPSLRDYLDPADGRWGSLFAAPLRLEFAEYDELGVRHDTEGAPIVLPVHTECQAEKLRSIRARHAMTLLVAVTNDVTGHSTYLAIRAGANFVINLAISIDRQAEVLRARLLDHVSAQPRRPRPPVLGAVPDRAPAAREPRPARDTAPVAPNGLRAATPIGRPELDEFDARLLRMLKTSMTVAEIARQNYLSERSMYRRIRNLYDVLGVSGRNDLVNAGALEPARAPLTVLRG